MSELGQRLIASLEQAYEYEKGDKSKGKSRVIFYYTPEEITQIRKKYDLTRQNLSEVLDVSARTVEEWETGVNIPSGPANRLLRLLETDNENKIIGMLLTVK